MCALDPQMGKVFSSAQIGGLYRAPARRGDADPGHCIDKTPLIKDEGTVVDLDTLSFESVYVWGTLP